MTDEKEKKTAESEKSETCEKDVLDEEGVETDECDVCTMTYADGTQEDYYEIERLGYNGKNYVFLQPVDMPDNFAEDEVIVNEISTDKEGREVILPISDEKLLSELVDYLNKTLENQ
jgi:hypothetical protein